MSILLEIQRAGWDPFDPSDECHAATDVPSMFAWLSEIDRLGIYHNYLTLVLFSRFARGTKDGDNRRRELAGIAMVFALRRTNLGDALDREVVLEWVKRIDAWGWEVLLPADRRMEEADPREVLSDPKKFEPAFTLSYLTVNMGIVDVDRDRELMSLGRAMHEEDSDRPQERIPTSDEELAAFHAWLTEQGNTIARISDEGKIEIDPLQVKTWMERRMGPVIQAKGARPTAPKHDDDSEDALEALMAADQVEAVRRVRDARFAEADEGSARWHVLQSFFELARNEMTFRDLGVRVGLSASALQEAFANEREAIRKAIRAA